MAYLAVRGPRRPLCFERLEDFKALVKSNKALLSIDPKYFLAS